MKEFEIFKLECEKYDYLVLLKTTKEFYYIQKEISNSIKEKDSKVLVDFIIRNGFQFNRFFEFVNPKLDSIKMVLPNDITDSIKKISMNYIIKNDYLLDESSLARKKIDIIKSIYSRRAGQV